MCTEKNVESTGKSTHFSRYTVRVRISSTPGNTSRLLDILKRTSFKVAHLVSSFMRSVSSLNVTSRDAMRNSRLLYYESGRKNGTFHYLPGSWPYGFLSAILSARFFIDGSPQFSGT